MRVFISWSGERSNAVAKAVRDWLPLVLHYVEPWLSEADIDAGERWAQSVAGELEASNFGIVCVTADNVNAPWVLFEAGALTKSLQSTRVIPLLYDIDYSEISGPLAQFQAKKPTKAGMSEVIQSIQAAHEEPIPEGRANQLIEALWPQLEVLLAEVPEADPDARQVRPQHEVLEELVASVRALDTRMRHSEELLGDLPSPVRRRRFDSHHLARATRDIEHRVARSDGDPVRMLLAASTLRESVPWLYELWMSCYRSIVDKPRSPAVKQVRQAIEASEIAVAGIWPLEDRDALESIDYLIRVGMDYLDSRAIHGGGAERTDG